MNENLRSDGFVGLGNEDRSEDRKNNWRMFEIKLFAKVLEKKKTNMGQIKEGFHVANK